MVLLFKTPTANLGKNGSSQHPDKRKAGGHGPTLDDEVSHLLSAPVAAVQDWGVFDPAVRRQEALSGVPAPLPTELGPRGGRRLAAGFAERVMWIPPGHGPDVPGVDPCEAVQRIGNGAVPVQAYAAYDHLLRLMRSASEIKKEAS